MGRPNPQNLKRGNRVNLTGRPAVVREAREWERRFLDSEEYRASAAKRVLEGRAPHLEKLWHEHVHGKATERIEVAGDASAPLRWIQVNLGADKGAA